MPGMDRNYKDSLFRMLFNEPKALLSLYNALNRTDYQDPDGLTINTLEGGGIFMKFRNDVSFVFSSQLTLIEHQSTVNSNMPLRNLFYLSDLLRKRFENRRKLLYRRPLLRFPRPHFVVLYNGKEDRPLIERLRLSDAFEQTPDTEVSVEPDIELIVTVYNINIEKQLDLLERCRTLREYSILVKRLGDAVKGISDDAERRDAASKVIDQCIREEILRDFLVSHKDEVINMYFWEYDEEAAHEALIEDGRDLERENTERERRRADEEKKRADKAEKHDGDEK